jgi:hypothetical protein
MVIHRRAEIGREKGNTELLTMRLNVHIVLNENQFNLSELNKR